MNIKLNDLGLSIPILSTNAKLSIKPETDAFLGWKDRLIITDTGKTAKEVYDVLINLNHSPCTPIKRFNLLEILNPVLQQICITLSKHFLQQNNELNSQQKSVAKLTKTLQTEQANGYKLVLNDFIEQKLPLTNEKNTAILVQTINRCLQNFANIIFRLYALYASPPPGMWKEIHTLYKISKKLNILNITPNQTHVSKTHPQTILDNYLYILVVAATDPYQIRTKDQETLFKASLSWIKKIQLITMNNKPQNLNSIYLIDPKLDIPLMPLSASVIPENSAYLTLNVSALTKHIQSILQELETNELKTRIQHENDAEYNISMQSLKILVKGWSNTKVRNTNRFKLKMNMHICVGLSAVYYFLNNQTEFATDTQYADTLMGIDTDKPKSSDKYKVFPCSVNNLSPLGLSILLNETNHPTIKTGEIIGMQFAQETSKNSWSIGTVRWLRYESDHFKIGVELLAANATTASIQLLRNEQPSGQYLRCLILSKLSNEKLGKSIVTPTMPFKSTNAVTIKFDDTSTTTTLGTELNSTGNFKQFSITLNTQSLNDKLQQQTELLTQVTTQDQKPDENNTSEFGNLWDKL